MAQALPITISVRELVAVILNEVSEGRVIEQLKVGSQHACASSSTTRTP